MKKFGLWFSFLFLTLYSFAFSGFILLSIIVAFYMHKYSLILGAIILSVILFLNIKSLMKYNLIFNNNYQYNILPKKDWILIAFSNLISFIIYYLNFLND